MQLTTSLRLCREHRACDKQYARLVRALGPEWGDDQPIPLTMLLDLHGTPGWHTTTNTIWAMIAVPMDQAEARDRVTASYCIDALGGIPGPPEHAHAVQVLRAFAAGRATIEGVRKAARDAWDAWVAWDAWDARDAWVAWDARAARVAWAARAAWDARVARVAWDARAARVAWDRAILQFLLEEEAARDD